jgi:hypothetical protein
LVRHSGRTCNELPDTDDKIVFPFPFVCQIIILFIGFIANILQLISGY